MANRTEFTFQPGQASIALSRVFEAPHWRVFEAWTQPEQVKRWYNLQGFTLSHCEIDLRAEGKWRLVFNGPLGREHGVSGEYREVAPPHRLVQSCRHDDAPHLEAVETLEFRDNDGKTLFTSTMVHKSVDNRDKHIRSGMQDGATQILDRLAEHLEGGETEADGVPGENLAAASGRSLGTASGSAVKARADWRLLAAALLVLFLAAEALHWFFGQGAIPRYVTEVVDRGPVSRTVTVAGVVERRADVDVRAVSSGKIRGLYCDAGMKVKAGQLCAKIDSRHYQSLAARNKAELAVAERRLKKDAGRLVLARTTLERNKALAGQGGAASKALNRSVAALEREQSRVTLDRKETDRLRAALQLAEKDVKHTEIISPIDGTVASQTVAIGQTVQSGKGTRLFVIVPNLALVRVAAHVNAAKMGEITLGDKASLTANALHGRVFEGKISRIEQPPEPEGPTSGEVFIDVPNPDLLLAPGMEMAGQIIASQRVNVIRIPDRAFRYSPSTLGAQRRNPGAPPPGWARLWILREEKAAIVLAKPGLDDGAHTEMVKGDLLPGDRLIVGERFEK